MEGIVESNRPRSWNGLPGAAIRCLNLAENLALQVMLILLRYAPPVGAIGASLVVNCWAINSKRRSEASSVSPPGRSGVFSPFSNSRDVWDGVVGPFLYRRFLSVDALSVRRWRALILVRLARRPETQMFEDSANNRGVIDQRDYVHRRPALGAFQRIV